jgi:site-specific DNA recombinase
VVAGWSLVAIAELYLHGLNGDEMGSKQIAAHFNERGPSLRGARWTRTRVHQMLSDAAYKGDYVFNKKNMRTLQVKPARVVNSPTLLTGLLRCAKCGAGMTLATGKGGQYRYYKCNTRIGQGIDACDTPAVPMTKLDAAVRSGGQGADAGTSAQHAPRVEGQAEKGAGGRG